MTASIGEAIESRAYGTGRDAGVEVRYHILDAMDETDALSVLESEAPSTWEGYTLLGLKVEPNQLESLFVGIARYGPLTGASANKSREVGDTWSGFDTSGETEHITQSLAVVATYGSGAPTNNGAIGDDGENVQGCDIPTAAYNFSITKIFDGGDIGATEKSVLFSLTDTTNQASVTLDEVLFNPREVLFRGATAAKRLKEGGGSIYEITFNFAAKPNRTGLVVGNITGIAKKGWEYMDVRYEAAHDDTAKKKYQKPIGVVIHQVFHDGDFSNFSTYFGI